MAKEPPAPQEFVDFLGAFDKGINNYPSPLLLPKDQLASALNTTVRGTFVTQRSVFRKISFDATSQALINSAFGTYQGGCFYRPDSGSEQIAVEIGGNFLIITPSNLNNTATVVEPPYTGGGPAPEGPNPATQPQAWLWQSENFVIVNDGLSLPLFYNGVQLIRSNYGTITTYPGVTVTTSFVIPAVGATVSGVTLTGANQSNINVGDILTIKNFGLFLVQAISVTPTYTLVNQNGQVNATVTAGSAVQWQHQGTQLPPGRQGAYIMGRNVMALVDAEQFVVSDQVGGSSGLQAENYRDAVLNITENTYLAGGGNFRVPGSFGVITAIVPTAQLDSSLGQGPATISTSVAMFSLNLPTDRLTWQDVTNPILPPSLLNDGATGQYSTISVNSDVVFRSPFGIRSLIIARRDFDIWGNTQQSKEIDPLISLDNPGLLQFESSIVFDNRYLLTISPSQITQGVIFPSIAVINLDPLSSLGGKSPSVYDSLQWSGLQVFQLFQGKFNQVERAFALTWNTNLNQCELYEILPSANTAYLDNDITRIVWEFQSASLFKENQKIFKRLIDGEIMVDELEGLVDFQFWYKPDQWPCWVPWFQWQECQTQPAPNLQPGFRPRMGLGEPSGQFYDLTNNRSLRLGFTFQVRGVITGKCRFLGGRFRAIEESQPEFAQPNTNGICPTA